MSQFTEAQLETIKAAVEFLAETQKAAHAHIADDVQAVLDLFKPAAEEPVVQEVVVEAESEAVEAPVEAAAEEAPAKE